MRAARSIRANMPTELARRRDLETGGPPGPPVEPTSPPYHPRFGRDPGQQVTVSGSPAMPPARTVGELRPPSAAWSWRTWCARRCSGCSTPRTPRSSTTFRWDMHHENPVTTAEDLAGPARLLSYDELVGSTTTSRRVGGLDAVASLAPGDSLEFNHAPCRRSSSPTLLDVAGSAARTVGSAHGPAGRSTLGTARRDARRRCHPGRALPAARGDGRTRGRLPPRALPAPMRLEDVARRPARNPAWSCSRASTPSSTRCASGPSCLASGCAVRRSSPR